MVFPEAVLQSKLCNKKQKEGIFYGFLFAQRSIIKNIFLHRVWIQQPIIV